MELDDKTIAVSSIGNYYGGLHILEHEGKYYWIIENFDTNFDDLDQYEEITKELYDAIIKNKNG